LRWTIGWSLASAVALALGPADARETAAISQPAPADPPIQSAEAQSYPAQPAYTRAQSPFDQYKAYLAAKARSQGVRESTINAVIPTLELNSRVIELDRAQRPTARSDDDAPPSFAGYLARHVTTSLIRRGQSRYSSHWPNLYRIQQRYGVDPAVIMAIYGKETSYGSVTGGFDLLQVLATLAYEGRRRALFEDEFIATMKLMDIGVRRYQLRGSYAGATGYPQFLPSTYMRIGTDGDGDGKADIWTSDADALASISAYLQEAGWKPNAVWGVAVTLPSDFDRNAVRSPLVSPRCPRVHARLSRWLTLAEWKARGVIVAGYPAPADNELAQLLEPDGPGMPAYLLTTNYRAILDYNCSNFYAMSVGVLADAIAR